jgi:GT2 family glycosyltransferase
MFEDCAIVVATHNRAAILEQTLQRLYELPEEPAVIVVDNASTDDTERVWKRFADRVRFLKLRRNVGAAARTIGAREARTPFVAFCDDDCYWTGGSLERAVARFHRYSGVAVLNACVLIGDSERPDPACQAMGAQAAVDALPGVPIVYFMAGACVMRTAAFLDVGGYHERYFIGAEESLLSIDLAARGWTLWYCDDLIVRHHPSPINRDPATRRRLVLRNRLWTVLLRRPLSSAVRAMAQYVRMAREDRVVLGALADALAGLPWIVRERHRIPRDLERRVQALDRALTL